MKKFLFALSLAFAALAASAQTQNSCAAGQGCNDPNAQQVNATVPGGGLQKPPVSVGKTTAVTDVAVDREIHIKDGETRVYNNLRPFCLNFTPGAVCGGHHVQTSSPTTVILATQAVQSYAQPATKAYLSPRKVAKKAKKVCK